MVTNLNITFSESIMNMVDYIINQNQDENDFIRIYEEGNICELENHIYLDALKVELFLKYRIIIKPEIAKILFRMDLLKVRVLILHSEYVKMSRGKHFDNSWFEINEKDFHYPDKFEYQLWLSDQDFK